MNMNNSLNSASHLQFIETPNRNKTDEYKTTYTKEYVTELKNIHQKEKNELLFKINSLERTLERLKGNLGDQLTKMQSNVEESKEENSSKLKRLEEEHELQLKKVSDEKDFEIDKYKSEIEKYKKVNNDVLESFKQNEEDIRKYKEATNDQISNLQNQLESSKNEYEKLKSNVDFKISKITNEYENKIKTIMSQNEAEITENNIKHKMQIDSMNNDIEQKGREIYMLRQQCETNEQKYNALIKELDQENTMLRNELQYTQEQNTALYEKLKFTEKTLMNTQSENDIAMKSLQRQREEISRKGEEIVFLENSIEALKNSNNLLQDKNNKLQKDYSHLYSHAENMNYEYSTKLKSLNYVEDKNFVLERENNELRNKLGKFVRPYTFK